MAFPVTPINLTVKVALGADLTAAPSTWVYTDATDFALAEGLIQISYGAASSGVEIPPAKMSFFADNADGRWCATNPTGTWYGQIGKGTPIQVTVDEGTESVRFTGSITALPPRWDPSENFRYVPVEAAGVTQRLGRGKSPLRSAMRRMVSAIGSHLVAYWPGEDESEATSLAEFHGGPAMTWSGEVTPASDGPAGSAPLPEMTSLAGLAGVVPTYTATGEWTVFALIDFPSTTVVSADTVVLRWNTTGSLPMWQWVLKAGSPDTINLEAYDGAGTLVVNHAVSFTFVSGVEGYDRWFIPVVTTWQDGGNLAYEFALFSDPEGSHSLTASGTSGSGGNVSKIGIPQSAKHNGTHLGHFAVTDIYYDLLAMILAGTLPIQSEAIEGYAGETVSERVDRLGVEENVGVETTSTAGDLMGPQPRTTLLACLREAEAVNGGRLVDTRDPTVSEALLRMVWRQDIENQDPVLELDHNLGHVSIGFEPTDDDQNLRNDWTVSRTGGSSGRVIDVTGPLGTEAVGVYDDSTTLNVYADTQLVDQAGHRVNLGTVQGLRIPRLVLDFKRNPDLIEDWINCQIGSRITVANPPPGMPPDDIDVIIEGYTETFSPFTWDVVLNCSPYQPYLTFVLADSAPYVTPGRLAGDPAAAIRAAIDDNDTTIVVDPNRTFFTTVADHFDPDIEFRLGGEVVAVSSIATTAGTFVAVGSVSNGDNSTRTPGLYAGHTADDLILVIAAIRNSGTGTVDLPAGYTRLPFFADDVNVAVFAKVHDGTESNPSVSFTGGSAGDTTSAFTMGFRGTPVSLTDLTHIVVDHLDVLNASAQDIIYPGVYPWLQERCIHLLVAWKQDDYTSIAVPTGFTEAIEASTTTASDQSLYVAYRIDTTSVVANGGTLTVTGGASAISRAAMGSIASGYQTFTVSARSLNGVEKSHAVGTRIEVENAAVLSL